MEISTSVIVFYEEELASLWLNKCKGLEGEGGVRDSTEVSALGNSMGDDKLFSEMGNTEVWRWNMVQFGPC